MQLDWTTFFLEILNFLILVWLLSRFFYRPIMNIIARRREDIKKHMDEALQARTEAQILQQKYATRVQDWEQEKSATRRKLHDEIEKQRKQLMEQLHDELDQERQKEDVINQRRLAAETEQNERQALEQGAAFSARLLARLAGSDLETSIVRLFLEDLAALAPEQQQILKSAYSDHQAAVTVYSAYPLADNRRNMVEKSMAGLLGSAVQCQYQQDPSLVAGLRVVIGSRLLQATIQDELKYFIEGEHAGQ